MNRLGRTLGVRPGEGRLVASVAAVFATVEAARGFGEVAVDSLVITAFGADVLPYLFIGLGAASLVAALAYGAALGRFRRGALFTGLLLAMAIGLGLEQIAFATGARLVPLLWLSVYGVGAIAVTLVWTLAGAVLDARQAKRLFPICTSAAIAGSFVGTLGAGPAAFLIGTEWLVAIEALLLAVGAILVGRLAASAAGPRLRTPPARRPVAAELRAGFDFVVRSPLMRLVAVAYVLFSVLLFSVTSPFFRAMAETFPADATTELTTFLGLLSAAVTATSFIVSLVVAPRVYARFGVATAALVLPVVYLGGFLLWLVQFSAATAVLVRFTQQVTQRGISNAAWGAFYNTVPAERRAQVLAFTDGVPGQIGIVLSGVLLLTAGAVLAPGEIFWLGAVTAAVCVAVVSAIRRRYGDSLVRALRTGLGEQVLEGGPGLGALATDAQTTATLVAGLESSEPAVRRTAAELLGRLGVRDAATAVMARIADDDPSVRAAALDAVARLDAGTSAIALDGALDDPDPQVRAAAVRAGAALDPDSVVEAADRLAADPSADVRAGLAVALAMAGDADRPAELIADLLAADEVPARVSGLRALGRLDGRLPVPVASGDPVIDALGDEARTVRRAAADILRARPAPPEAVFGVLDDGPPHAQEAALWALDGHGPVARERVLAWAARQVARATALRGRLAALDGRAPTADDRSLAFLAALLARRLEEIQGRLLAGLAVLGAPEAAGLVRRCLRSPDPDTRAQAIEALDSLGDARLRRAVVALLDEARPGVAGGEDRVLQDLAGDPDRWIRALALRARAERVAADWSTIRQQSRGDPDPVVRDALGQLGEHGGPSMADTARTLGDLDRMLFLRRVPLFAELAPEDLQRLAMTAVERLYPADHAVVREGEVGNELIVIVEGAVRVVRSGEDERERLIRRYAAGDHFGELAVLREAPRAATVVAEPPGVRGLVIGGDGLMAILRERPEAAMAMLATLAERISAQ